MTENKKILYEMLSELNGADKVTFIVALKHMVDDVYDEVMAAIKEDGENAN